MLHRRVVVDPVHSHVRGGVHLRGSEETIEFLKGFRGARPHVAQLYLSYDLGIDGGATWLIIKWLDDMAKIGEILDIDEIRLHCDDRTNVEWILRDKILMEHYLVFVTGMDEFI